MKHTANSGPNSEAPRKKLCLSLKNKKLSPSKCFGSVSEEESLSAAKGIVPVNTKATNEWALRNLRSWMETRNNNCVETVPNDLLSCDDGSGV